MLPAGNELQELVKSHTHHRALGAAWEGVSGQQGVQRLPAGTVAIIQEGTAPSPPANSASLCSPSPGGLAREPGKGKKVTLCPTPFNLQSHLHWWVKRALRLKFKTEQD